MRIVLRTDLANVGKRGDICEVADGYARNYLLPKGHAIVATPGVATQAAAMRRSRDLRDARDREAAETVARTLVPMVIRIPAKAGSEGKLFGSVTNIDLERALRENGLDIERRKIHLPEPIKQLGDFTVPVKLDSEVEASLKITVAAQAE